MSKPPRVRMNTNKPTPPLAPHPTAFHPLLPCFRNKTARQVDYATFFSLFFPIPLTFTSQSAITKPTKPTTDMTVRTAAAPCAATAASRHSQPQGCEEPGHFPPDTAARDPWVLPLDPTLHVLNWYRPALVVYLTPLNGLYFSQVMSRRLTLTPDGQYPGIRN